MKKFGGVIYLILSVLYNCIDNSANIVFSIIGRNLLNTYH
jgi:hypothetical protein